MPAQEPSLHAAGVTHAVTWCVLLKGRPKAAQEGMIQGVCLGRPVGTRDAEGRAMQHITWGAVLTDIVFYIGWFFIGYVQGRKSR